jgi:hypothetical protein
MKSVDNFNGLNGRRATRQEIERQIDHANSEEQFHIAEKLREVLDGNPDEVEFIFEIPKPLSAIERKSKIQEIEDKILRRLDLVIERLEGIDKNNLAARPSKNSIENIEVLAREVNRRENKSDARPQQADRKTKKIKAEGLSGGIQSAKEIKDKSISGLEKMGFVSASEVPDEPKDVFHLPGDIGKFIQKIQPFKALILIKGTKHTSKSQLAMQIANGIAETGRPVAYIDYEQGGMECKDTIDSINRNTSEEGRRLIAVKGFLEKPMEELQDFCKHCSAIVADSVTDLGITADQLNELRNKYPKVIWVFISQVKENGEMYGGNKMAHNPTAIIKCHPSHDPKERFATLEKNRGNDLSLKYSMYDKKLIEDKPEAAKVSSIQPKTPLDFSFNVIEY